MPAWFRTGLFWLHWVVGLLVSLAVTPMAVTGAMMAFEREITAWVEADVRVVDTGAPPLLPSELVRRAARELGADKKPNTVQLYRDRTVPALLTTEHGIWLVDPYDGHVLRASVARQVFAAAEKVHRSVGLAFVGARRFGTTVAGLVAIGILLLALSGPWLWWPRKTTRSQLRRRVWFTPTKTAAARDFAWHHVIGIWCMPVLLAISCTGILLGFSVVTAGLGKTPKPRLLLDADAAVLAAQARAPQWSALRISWNDKGGTMLRVQLGRGVRPTQWANLDSGPRDARGASAVVLRRYEDGRPGDKVLGWARWLHTGQALGRSGQAVWFSAVIGLLVLVWTGVSLALRRVRRAIGKTPLKPVQM